MTNYATDRYGYGRHLVAIALTIMLSWSATGNAKGYEPPEEFSERQTIASIEKFMQRPDL